MSKAIRHLMRRIQEGHMHGDARRNFRILIFASLLNISFALEKLTLMLGYTIPNVVWFGMYGGLAIFLAIIAFQDLAKDLERNEELKNQQII